MRGRLPVLLAAIAVTVLALVVGWRAYQQPPDAGPEAGPEAGPAPGPSASAEPAAPPSVTAVPKPADLPPSPRPGACHRMSYSDVVAPTASQRDVPCDSRHTSVTYAVGELDTVVGGHLVTVDSQRVRDQVARVCPDRFAGHVGGTLEQRRLSLLRSVGFTPTVEQSDRGANWFRCDAVAVAGRTTLATLDPGLAGVLGTDAGRLRYGLCATAGPGTSGFRTVICSGAHSWQAVRTVTFDSGSYPGTARVRDAGTRPCRAAGRAASGDALDFRWGYEWPTAEQWRDGRTYGICWVPA